MTKLDWMLFAYGTSGWIVAWASSPLPRSAPFNRALLDTKAALSDGPVRYGSALLS
jgi:hypothetical protein